MATWLACDHLDFRGAVTVARGWLPRARRALEGLDLQPKHGWLAIQEGCAAHLTGDTGGAQALADRAAAIGRRFDVPDLVRRD